MSLRTRSKHAIVAVTVAAFLGVGATGVATAQSHAASIEGSKAWSNTTYIYNKDTLADSQWSRSNWNSASGSGGISNYSGYNATVYRNTGKDITAVQACRSRTLLPMACSSWNNLY